MEKNNKGLTKTTTKKAKPTVKAPSKITAAAYNRAKKEIAYMEQLLRDAYGTAGELVEHLNASDDTTSFDLAMKIYSSTLIYAEHNKEILAVYRAKLK